MPPQTILEYKIFIGNKILKILKETISGFRIKEGNKQNGLKYESFSFVLFYVLINNYLAILVLNNVQMRLTKTNNKTNSASLKKLGLNDISATQQARVES